ncbi:hypothetical protein KJ855_02820, partial [Patescibacteria group bacterium]|nr:hypothetical protein [Patescibacteria group bacterium]
YLIIKIDHLVNDLLKKTEMFPEDFFSSEKEEKIIELIRSKKYHKVDITCPNGDIKGFNLSEYVDKEQQFIELLRSEKCLDVTAKGFNGEVQVYEKMIKVKL